MATLAETIASYAPAVETLTTRLKEHLSEEKLAQVREAFAFCAQAHEGQRRVSGEPFVVHPLQTALILTDIQVWDAPTIQAALLHDVVEDSAVSLEDIERRFGAEVARLVDGVTKLSRLTTQPFGAESEEAELRREALVRTQAESLRKMLVAMAQDVRVVFIKLADRLHNMRTLGVLPAARRRRIAQETRDIYAPLAHRLGIYQLRWELEDLAFRYLEPQHYRQVVRLLNTRRAERERDVQVAVGLLKDALERSGYKADVAGRPKSLYSIYDKMRRYEKAGRAFGDIHDLLAIRVVMPTVQDCYAALGVVHSVWRPLPGQFDDYIASPRQSGYQSLHTAVQLPDEKPLEVQIRTPEMHRIAEYGLAAHWRYKEGGMADARFEERITWLRQLLDWQREVTGAEEFVEQVKQDILPNQVFVYTPKGEIRELPAGSTPLDFAFRIHTNMGYRAVGAKVNGRLVSFEYQLRNGDTVEIMVSKTEKGPSLDWLNPDLGYVKTESARSRIRQWFRRRERAENLVHGRQVLEKEARRLSTPLEPAKLAELFNYESEEEFLIALGTGTVSASQVAARLAPPEEQRPPAVRLTPDSGDLLIEVAGMGLIPGRTGRCCRPLPGEDIIGFITRNRGVTVHRKDCANIQNEDEPERFVDVSWPARDQVYPVSINIESADRVGLLRDITTVVSAEHVNITDIRDRREPGRSVTIYLAVETTGLVQVSRLLSRLEGLAGVRAVYRLKGGALQATTANSADDRRDRE